MKKLAIALLITGSALGAAAQNKGTEIKTSEVPQTVISSFNSNFTNTNDVEWKKKDDGYMVSFEVNHVDQHAWLDASGKVIMKGNQIRVSELPAAVRSAVEKDYPRYRIDDVYTMIEGTATSYKIDLDGSEDRKVVYSAGGKMLKDQVEDN